MEGNMKKISYLLILALSVIVLAGCWNAQIKSQTVITSIEGAGSKTITVEILKDGQTAPDGSTVANEPYLVKGWEGVDEWLEQNTPEGFTVEKKETETSYIYSITYDFKDIDDYNAKTKRLIGETRYEDYGFLPATLIAEKTNNDQGVKGYQLTFTEDVRILYASVGWAFEGIFYNDELFNRDPYGTGEIEISDIYELTAVTIKIGDEETTFDLTAEEHITLTEVVATGFIEESWVSVPAIVGIVVAVVVVFGSAGLVFLKIRKSKS